MYVTCQRFQPGTEKKMIFTVSFAKGSVVDTTVASQRSRVLIPGTCHCVTLHVTRDLR